MNKQLDEFLHKIRVRMAVIEVIQKQQQTQIMLELEDAFQEFKQAYVASRLNKESLQATQNNDSELDRKLLDLISECYNNIKEINTAKSTSSKPSVESKNYGNQTIENTQTPVDKKALDIASMLTAQSLLETKGFTVSQPSIDTNGNLCMNIQDSSRHMNIDTTLNSESSNLKFHLVSPDKNLTAEQDKNRHTANIEAIETVMESIPSKNVSVESELNSPISDNENNIKKTNLAFASIIGNDKHSLEADGKTISSQIPNVASVKESLTGHKYLHDNINSIKETIHHKNELMAMIKNMNKIKSILDESGGKPVHVSLSLENKTNNLIITVDEPPKPVYEQQQKQNQPQLDAVSIEA
ncbi:hypothetical protein L3V83_06035 [Thiotrichales bacterium 19X7-9]|nr:hypothetical protein [Thiotrichales bacterium 19X7-9]